MGLPVEINNLMMGAVSGYQVGRSLRFRSSASAYLNRTPASAGSRTTWTWSAWVKRGSISSAANQTLFATPDPGFDLYFSASTDTLYAEDYSGGYRIQMNTTQVFRDPSAWYHIVYAVDTTQATASNRWKLYINGVQVTAFGTATYPTQNTNLYVNTGSLLHGIGSQPNATPRYYFDGYLAEVNFIDGQALTPSSFGAYDTNGVWQPAKYTGTYGTNGFYLPFSNGTSTTTLGYDQSGNSNNWTTNNISLTAGTTYDSMQDVPTNNSPTVGNFAVLNPLDKNTNIALSNGNLTAIPSSTADYWLCRATMAFPSSGKWYWELTLNNTPYLYQAGIYSSNRPTNGATSSTGNEYQVAWGTAYTYIQYQSNNAAFAAWGTNTNPTNGDVLMFAVDSGNSTMWIGRNGTWYNTSGTANPATNTDPRFSSIPSGMFAGVNLPNPASGGVSLNFGQRPFSYTPPTGFVALNTYNLPAPSIKVGAQYMAATTYTGNGTSQSISNAVNGFSFQPDFVWYKDRSVARDHALFNVTSGATYLMSSNNTSAESAVAGTLTSFNSNGYSIGSAANANANGETYVGWQWKGGGTAVSNNSGTITSSVSANASAGFSVVTYTGTGANATVGHGLGVAPSMIILRARSIVENWPTWHTGLTSAAYVLTLNTTNAQASVPSVFNSTAPTSSVFSVGTSSGANQSSATYVAYCFAAVSSYSAFGSYNGTGSADGPFVYVGFRPRWIMFKNASTSATNWIIFDTSRNTYNVSNLTLDPASSNAELTSNGWDIDILSNGFKVRNTSTSNNGSGNTIIYACFSENPFQISRAR